MARATLGKVVGTVFRTYNDVTNDPMNFAVGYQPDPFPAMRRKAAELGWTFPEILAELDARGVSGKWQYDHGVGLLEQDEPGPRRSL